MARIDPDRLTLKDKVVFINRVSKTVKGGKRFSFSAVVVVGDGEGHIGLGKGKAAEVPEAIRKAVEYAKRHLVFVCLHETTIPFETIGRYGAEEVILKPASQGTGIKAGGPVRAVMEVLGVSDILSKSLGSGNPVNVVKAVLEGLSSLKTRDSVFDMRRSQMVTTE